MLLASALGAIIGITLGLTGAGGGILAVPALVLGMGFPMQSATPVALIAVGMAAMVGALDGLRRGTVRYKAAALMAIVGSLVSPLGIMLAGQLSPSWLLVMFSAVMVLVAVRMLRQAMPSASASADSRPKACMLSESTGRFIWNRRSGFTIAGIGATSGLFTGLLGVGGGFIIVPALKHFSNVGMHGIVSTSLMVITLISATTVANALIQGVAVPVSAWWFVGFTIVGMVGGRLLAPLVPARALQAGFAVVCLAVAGLLLFRALGA